MKKGDTPSIYQVEFSVTDEPTYENLTKGDSLDDAKDEVGILLSEIVFEPVYEELPVQSTRVHEVKEEAEMRSVENLALPEKIGQIVTSPELEVAIADNATAVTSEKTTGNMDESIITLPMIPKEATALASKTVDELLKQTDKILVPIAQLSDIAFGGQKVPKQQFRDFIEALNEDLRLEYLGNGEYRIRLIDNIIQPYWPGENPEIVTEQITQLVDHTLDLMLSTPYPRFSIQQLLGIVKSQGIYLAQDEMNEFFAILTSDPRVIALENGDFKTKVTHRTSNGHEEKGILVLNQDEDSVINGNSKSMTTRQIAKTLKDIKYRPEAIEARERAQRLANPRRRGRNRKSKGSRMQGKNHGKKASIDELIAKMNQPKTDKK